LHVKTNQAYLITAGFLHKHIATSMSAKICCCISKSSSALGGLRLRPPDSLTRGFASGPLWGHSPQTLTAAPTSLPEIFLALSVK